MVASPPVCSMRLCIACTVPHEPGFSCRWEHVPWHVSLGVMQAGEEKDLHVFCDSCPTARIRIWPFLKKNEGVPLHYKGVPCVILDSSGVWGRICFSGWGFLCAKSSSVKLGVFFLISGSWVPVGTMVWCYWAPAVSGLHWAARLWVLLTQGHSER